MADRDFVVKNGLVVNTSLILANTTSTRVGIANATPDATLTVGGAANVQGNAVITGTTRLNGNLTIATSAGIIANGSIGTSGQALISNGTTVYWSNPIATPNTNGGTGSVQYYNGSILGSSAGITFSETTNTLTVANNISVGGATINGSVYTGAANNATYLGDVLYSNYVNTAGAFTRTGVTTFNANLVIGTAAGISGNGTYGTAGQFLASNGTTVYWAVPTTNVNSQYAWTNTQSFSNTITFSGSLNVTGTIVSTNTFSANGNVGTAGYVLTSGGTGANVYWSPSASANTAGGTGAVQYYNGTSLGSSLGMSFSASGNNFAVSNNITASGNGVFLTTNSGAIYFNGTGLSSDANWRIGRNLNTMTKLYYTNNTLDIVAASSDREGIAFGFTANSYFEIGYNGAYTRYPIYVGNSTVNVSINSTSFSGTANNASYLGGTAAAGYQTTAGLSANIASYLPTYTGVVNAASHTTGTYGSVSANGITVNTTTIAIGNSSVNATVNSTAYTGAANNASYLGGTAAASYALLAGPTFTGTVTTANTLTIGTSTYFATNGNIGVGNSSPTTKMLITGGIALTPVALGTGNSFSVNCLAGNYYTLTCNGSATSITFTGAPASAMYSMVIKVTSGASNTLTWASAPKWPSATAPTASTNTDIWVFLTDDGGTTWRGNLSQKDSR